jgi:hypothetical protein
MTTTSTSFLARYFTNTEDYTYFTSFLSHCFNTKEAHHLVLIIKFGCGTSSLLVWLKQQFGERVYIYDEAKYTDTSILPTTRLILTYTVTGKITKQATKYECCVICMRTVVPYVSDRVIARNLKMIKCAEMKTPFKVDELEFKLPKVSALIDTENIKRNRQEMIDNVLLRNPVYLFTREFLIESPSSVEVSDMHRRYKYNVDKEMRLRDFINELRDVLPSCDIVDGVLKGYALQKS